MRVASLALLFVLSACSAQQAPTAASSPSANPKYNFSCRLPVLWFNQDPRVDGRVDGKTGFVNFPAGSLSTSTAILPAPPPLTLSFSYDQAVGRWLPVSREAVAPDGLHYAYAEYDPPGPNDGKVTIGTTGRVHLVDAQTGNDTVIYSGSPTWWIVDFASNGIYLARLTTAQYARQEFGLYLIDPAEGSPRLVPGSDVHLDFGGWRVLNGGAAWGTRFSDVGLGSGNELVRLDMKTGEVVQWLEVPTDQYLSILGFDAGNPLVSSSLSSVTEGQSSQTSIRLITSPGQSRQLYSSDAAAPGALGVADTHGIWMGGAGSIWLYQQASGIRPIHVLDDPNTVVEVGGACA